jgi:hypothetical protein
MANITSYKETESLASNDLFIISDTSEANSTKSVKLNTLSAYINGESSGAPGSGTVTSVSGTGSVSGITLSGTVTASGELTLGGSLSLTSQEIINFLGYTPSSFNGDYNNLTNKPALFDGAYNSLTGKPVLFDGDYNSLTNTPTLFDGAYSSLTGLPTLFDGDYDSLTNKPSIPAAPAILSNSGSPSLATGVTAEEIRTLIGAGDGTGSIESVSGTAPIVSSGGANPEISITPATTSAAGSMSLADKIKLDGIEGSAQVNVATDLTKTVTTTDVTINSSTGTDVSIGAASTTTAGVMTKELYDDVVANNAKVSNVSTDLGYTASTANGTITSSDGTNATVPLAVSQGNAGLMSGTDKYTLDNFGSIDDYVKNTSDTFTPSEKIKRIITLTQDQYDNTPGRLGDTLYIIVD